MQRLYAGTNGCLPEKSGPLLLLGAPPISSPLYSPNPGLPAGPQNESIFRVGVLALSASSLPAAHKLPGRNLQIGEVALGAGTNPQRDSSFPWLELQIVDDEAWLLGTVHAEPRFAGAAGRLIFDSKPRQPPGPA